MSSTSNSGSTASALPCRPRKICRSLRANPCPPLPVRTFAPNGARLPSLPSSIWKRWMKTVHGPRPLPLLPPVLRSPPAPRPPQPPPSPRPLHRLQFPPPSSPANPKRTSGQSVRWARERRPWCKD